MTLARMEHSGNASPTVLQIGITSAAASIVAVSGVGFPTGAVGTFVIVVDPDLANEEKILCAARSTNTFTVAPAGRGYDGTTASDHSSNAVIKHVWTANEADDTSDHIYGTSSTLRDDHTNYLTVVRHDITARHTFGAAFAVPAAATTSAVGDVAAPGVATGPARADHLHGREPYGVGLTTAIPPNTTAADGTSSSEARADHVHSRAASETFTNLTSTGTLTAATLNTATLAATTSVTAPSLSATGLTGATAASRYVGATASGAPTSGTFAVGDFVVDQAGYVWVCTVAGSPGTWASEAAQAQKITARAYRSVAWSLSTGQVLVFDTANFDPSLCFNSSGGAGKFTCPIAGYYQVSGALSCTTTASGQVMVSQLVKNVTVTTSGTFSGASSAAGQVLTSVVSDVVGCSASDVLTMAMQINPSNILGTIGSNYTYIAIQYLHP